MKSLILSILLISGITVNLIAQLKIGFKTGASFSNINTTNVTMQSNYRTAISLGIPVYYDIKNMALGLDCIFIQKGNRFNDSNTNSSQFKSHYLQITPNIDFKILKKIHLGFGMYYAFKLNEYNKLGSAEWVETSSLGTIKNSDFGITPSIGFSYKNFLLQLRYHYGLQDINNLEFTDINGRTISDVTSYNRSLEIGIIGLFNVTNRGE